MNVRWNLTGKSKSIKSSDVLILSIGKSGRTWLRVLINKYLSLAYDIPFSLEDMSKQDQDIPSLLYTHEEWAHFCNTTVRQRILGKHIVPDKILSKKKVILLFRDPRDVIVSLYFQSKRGRRRKGRKGNVSLMDLVQGSESRMPLIVRILNDWRRRLADHPDCLWVSYEGLMADTYGRFMEILKHIEISRMDGELATRAVEFSEFENMKRMEANDQFNSNILRPGDPTDPDSYKVRKGQVGGYVDYFSEEELPLLDESIADLDPFYGYYPPSGPAS